MNPSYYRIAINEQALEDITPYSRPTDVVITHELNKHSTAEVSIRQPLDCRFPIEDAIGKKLFIEAVDQEGNAQGVFSGFVLEAEIDYDLPGNYRCDLVGVTKSYQMDVTPRYQHYPTHDVSTIARELVGFHSLNVDLQDVPSDSQQTWHTQMGQTDWDFLTRLAAEHECWVRPDDDGVQVVKGFGQTNEHTLQWRAEGGLIGFKLRGKLKPKKMDGAQYDPASMESKGYTDVHSEPEFYPDTAADFVNAVKTESGNQLPNGYVYDRARARKHDLYQSKLERESRRSIGTALTCRGRSRNAKLLAGDTVKIESAADMDGTGKYALTKVVHRWNWKGYHNEFEGTIFKHFSAAAAPEPRRWHGVVPARVTHNNDPDNAGRLGVAYYWMPGGETTVWVRRLTPYAGQDRGFLFTPEVGDEVMIGFEGGDVELPYVMGSTWNGIHTAPVQDFWGDEYGNDDVKRIVTKSGHRIALSDKDGKESISLATPNHLRIQMFENADETGRPMISLSSETGDIMLSAPEGRILLRSKFYSRDVG